MLRLPAVLWFLQFCGFCVFHICSVLYICIRGCGFSRSRPVEKTFCIKTKVKGNTVIRNFIMEEDGFIDISFTKIEVWKYFLKNKMLQKAKCEMCKMILNCQRRSTSALKTHLKSRHNIKIENQSNLTQKSPRK